MRTVGEEEKTTARSGDRLAQSVNKTNVGFKKMFSYAFGIRSLFALFNRIRGAVTDGQHKSSSFRTYGIVDPA